MFKYFDEKVNYFEQDFQKKLLYKFIDTYSYPIIIPFNQRGINKIFENHTPALFLLSNDNDKSA